LLTCRVHPSCPHLFTFVCIPLPLFTFPCPHSHPPPPACLHSHLRL
jgi:hypothetical protein